MVCDLTAGELLELFQDCKLVMRWDVQTCLFLMPYIIHNTLDAGQDAAREQVHPQALLLFLLLHNVKAEILDERLYCMQMSLLYSLHPM